MAKIKLIWEFFGPDAEGIATHHAKHLEERKKIIDKTIHETGSDIFDQKAIAYIVVDESDMIFFRDTLRPHKGERITE